MPRNKHSASPTVCILCALVLVAGAAAQEVPAVLQVDIQNYTSYVYDVTDQSKLARSSGPVAPVSPANFYTTVGIADVTAVNGSPVKGVLIIHSQTARVSPTPTGGMGIADVARDL